LNQDVSFWISERLFEKITLPYFPIVPNAAAVGAMWSIEAVVAHLAQRFKVTTFIIGGVLV